MKVFFSKNVPVDISEDVSLWNNDSLYDAFVEGPADSIDPLNAKGRIIAKVSKTNLEGYLLLPRKKGFSGIQKVTLLVEDFDSIIKHIYDSYKIIYAAGGIVIDNNGSNVLMVCRMGKWELPKGKLELGEDNATAAVREVSEECNVFGKIRREVCTTWYSFVLKGKIYFKSVVWFEMSCIDASGMKPQREEGISKVAWIPKNKLHNVLKRSFLSIRHIFDKYFKW